MSEELLSALLDGECSPGEVKRLLDELEGSPALQRRWDRLCLVREAMEGTRIPAVSAGFCAGVMAAVERERAAAPAAPRPAKVVVMPSRTRAAAPAARSLRWQPLAGLAAAASIATVAGIGGYRWLNQPVGVPVQTAALSPAAAPVSAEPVAYTTTSATAPAAAPHLVPVSHTGGSEPVETRWSQLDAATARQLNEYMMEHSNLRAEQGVSAALSYPRMTVRTAEYRSGEQH
ncbi:MAG: sigma-E factor negative regulatory protein [Nevskia sp.]|nr:sigma-E factor negative regulatory protein [Nevskia sp.]